MKRREILKIIFISATCARADYDNICNKRKYPLLDSSQKFFEMFLTGLNQHENVTVDCITIPPISRGTYPGFFIQSYKTQVKNMCFHYTPVWNLPVLKSLFATNSVKRRLKKLIKKYVRENIKIICDPLLLEGLLPTIELGKKYGLTTIGFLTDMPDFADECDTHSKIKFALYRAYNKKIKTNLKNLDQYIVLTEAMSSVAGKKPWMLLDCMVDENMLKGISPETHSDNLPHVLYAGKLHKEFGLDLLGEAMTLVKKKCVFDLYGDGNYINELKKIAQKQDNIRIHGIVPLKEVLGLELSASVLINPRTSKGEFTKYSFPSKTAEYMLSGVPVVMFRLPGISLQYDKYINYAEEETARSLAKKIDNILSMPKEEWKKTGEKAKNYVLNNKNVFAQSKKVIVFLLTED